MNTRKLTASLILICLGTFTSMAQQIEPSWESLSKNYQCPEWFRDAKFGIFMHWGIQAAIDENRPYGGSHYGRYMYGPGEFPPEDPRSKDAETLLAWHTKRYGNPNKTGYKDLIPLFKAEKWNPDSLVAFYKECGAKYIVPVAVHHDNFDMFKSSLNKWNAYNMGPHKDILRGWKEAAEKYGLKFGFSSHLDRVPAFFQVSRKYDGGNPKYADFYGSNYSIDYQKDEKWMKVWYDRTLELVDNYQPDLLYFDGSLPGTYGDMKYGFELAAHYYNNNIKQHNGKLEAVLNLKHGPDKRAFVWDIERGQSDALQKLPWQTDTDLAGGWYYRNRKPNYTSDVWIGNLVDIVSKNGNLLLNVGLRGDGTLPESQAAVLRDMGAWLKVNGEGIYGSRPWLVYGEGPTKVLSGAFQEQNKSYSEKDIRFTTRNGYLYAFVLKVPENGRVFIKSLSKTLTLVNEIKNVQLLGSNEKITWNRTDDALDIQLPQALPCKYALGFKIEIDDKSREMWDLVIE